MLVLINILTDDSFGCKLCIDGLQTVYELIGSGATEKAIEEVLDKICQLFSSPEAISACDQFINEEYEKIIEWLEVGLPPSTLCSLLGACNYPIPPINGTCDVCVIAFTFLEDIWSYGPSIELMDTVLNHLCNIFPDGFARTECDKVLDIEINDVIAWIDTNQPPLYICQEIGGCPAQ